MPATDAAATSTGRLKALGRAARALLACLVVGATAGAVAPLTAGAAVEEVQQLAVWKPAGKPAGSGRLLLYAAPSIRVMYAVDIDGNWLATYDLDSLELRSTLRLGGTPPTAAMVDHATGQLYLAVWNGIGGGARLLRFGVQSGAVGAIGTFDLAATLGGPNQVIGLYRHPRSSLLWVMGSTSANGWKGMRIAELDVARMATGTVGVGWTRDLSGDCPVPMHNNAKVNAAIAYLPFGGALYFGCGAASGPNLQVPQNPGVARLFLTGDPARGPTQPGTLEKFGRPGEFITADSVIDVASGRILLSVTSAAAGGTTFYGFDARTTTYVGGASAGGNQFTSFGLDEVTGRTYGVTQDLAYGLVVNDLRPTPLPQARRYPKYRSHRNGNPETMTVPVDWETNRVFLGYTGTDEFLVLRDNVEAAADPSLADVDVNTTDVDEAPGRTRALYSGTAQGFGSRYRWIGGPQNLWFNLTGRVSVGPEESRELRGAYLNSLTFSNGEASAAAVAADRDTTTRSQQVVQPNEDAPALVAPWPYHEARCVDFGPSPQSTGEDGATVTCEAGKDFVEASTVLDQSSHDIGIKVGRSEYKARARRDPVRGTVVTVTSMAKNVLVTDGATEVLRMGEVRVDAEAWAKGRPGTAGTRYQRQVKDVYVQGEQRCAETCTLAELDRVARTLAFGKVQVAFPTPDARFAAGSPKGFQAMIRRSLPEQLQEVVVNSQPPERVEVPGVVVTVSFDNYFRDRMILELAAAEAEARYGISLDGPPAPDPDLGGGALVPLAALGDGTGIDPAGVGLGSPITGSPGGAGRRTPTSLEPIPVSVGRTAGLIWNGLGRAARLFPIWAVLLAPVYLSARRWLLLQRDSLVSGGRS